MVISALIVTILGLISFFGAGGGGLILVSQSSTWSLEMDTLVTDISLASFHSEDDNSGITVSNAGDVNGDGVDDILIGTPRNDQNGELSGKVYVIFGRTSGWSNGWKLSNADASFLGEDDNDEAGSSLSGGGDVNGDGFDDILVGAYLNGQGGNSAGKTYLIFGRSTGWSKDVNLSNADASFIGERNGEYSGRSVSIAGDINGDGYDDIIIGADGNKQGGDYAGKVYLIFGGVSGWKRDTMLYDLSASFLGEIMDDNAGSMVSGAGDVNGDGFDDVLIGTPKKGGSAGKTYLIFGKKTGWNNNVDLSLSDASFIGENANSFSGIALSGGGDVNGDGFDDILIGAAFNDQGSKDSGKTYLIFGKASGWLRDMDLSNADAAFYGEAEEDASGISVSNLGNVNGDGYDDILIGAYHNSAGGRYSGQTYLIYGKETGWNTEHSLSSANASFIGEKGGDKLGTSVSGAGDVNGDGFDDILIGNLHDWPTEEAGRAYLIAGKGYGEPYGVDSIRVRNGLGDETRKALWGDELKVEITGVDSDPDVINRARVNITFDRTPPYRKVMSLVETGKDTGVFKGKFKIPMRVELFEGMTFSSFADPNQNWKITVDYPFRPSTVTSIGVYTSLSSSSVVDALDIGQTAYFKCMGLDSNPATVDQAFINLSSDKNSSYRHLLVLTETGKATGVYGVQFTVLGTMQYFENITLVSVETPTRTAKFMVHTPVQVRTRGPYLEAVEDSEYRARFYNFGYNTVTWTATTNAHWLTWDDTEKELYGTPLNNDVSEEEWEVLISIKDNYDHSSCLQYYLKVINTPPNIITEPITDWVENKEYRVDFDCDDDIQGTMTWALTTNAPFLTIDVSSGIVHGIPIGGDAGNYSVKIRVDDGHGGFDIVLFNLTVIDENDPPQIITTDIKQVEQDTLFRRDYDVFDPDEGDAHDWKLRSDADWLSLESDTGVLSGSPDGYDVGDWLVNITVTDQGGLSDYREFTLKVLDNKDIPRFRDVPTDTEILHGTIFHFDVNASDADKNDRITYSALTDPSSDLAIDPTTGDLVWTADYRSMPSNAKGMKVTLKASDGQLFATCEFYIKVSPTLSPSVELISPAKGSRSSSENTMFEWAGTDPEGETLTYKLYLAESESYVTAMRSENVRVNDIEDDHYNMTGLISGKIYYWMVIPDDGCTSGICSNGAFSFRVNNKPSIGPIDDMLIEAGKEFMFKVNGNDSDQDDILLYKLASGPEGMVLSESTGIMVWTPKEHQVGVHTVKVKVIDGYEESVVTFRLEVGEGDGSSMGLLIGIAVGVLALIAIVFLLYIFITKGKEIGENREEENEDAKKMMEEMEQKKREKEWEEAHTKPSEQLVVIDVPDQMSPDPSTEKENSLPKDELGEHTSSQEQKNHK